MFVNYINFITESLGIVINMGDKLTPVVSKIFNTNKSDLKALSNTFTRDPHSVTYSSKSRETFTVH